MGFGFVCFKHHDGALRALSDLNGKDGLYIRQALKKTQRMQEIQKLTNRYKSSMIRYNLYFKNFPPGSTEDELKVYFT